MLAIDDKNLPLNTVGDCLGIEAETRRTNDERSFEESLFESAHEVRIW